VNKSLAGGAFPKTACPGSAPDARRGGLRHTTIRQTVSLATCALTAAVALAGCTGRAANEAAPVAVKSAIAEPVGAVRSEAAPGHEAEALATTSPTLTELPLVNTASVLFPKHTMTIEAIDAQKAAFRSQLEQIPPTARTASAVTVVRSGPSETDDVVAVLAPGDEVVVDGQVAHWFRITGDDPAPGGAGGGFVSGLALDSPDSTDGLAWTTTVTGSGDSAAVDACTGGLTEFTAMSRDLGVPAYAIHSYCGGEPVLALQVGDEIAIDGVRHRVATANDYPLFSSTEVMQGLRSDAFLQTCDLVAGQARVLGLEKLGG